MGSCCCDAWVAATLAGGATTCSTLAALSPVADTAATTVGATAATPCTLPPATVCMIRTHTQKHVNPSGKDATVNPDELVKCITKRFTPQTNSLLNRCLRPLQMQIQSKASKQWSEHVNHSPQSSYKKITETLNRYAGRVFLVPFDL